MQRLAFIFGIAVAAALLLFVNEINFLGNSCYFIGELELPDFWTGEGGTQCIKPGYYYFAWLIAVVSAAWGFIGFLPGARK